MMRRLLTTAAASVLLLSCSQGGQIPTGVPQQQLITRDGKVVAAEDRGVYNMYPASVPAAPKAPAGYKLCYLSHYGRHGSRYLQYDTQYVHIHDVLCKAHADGKLNELGESVYARYESVYPALAGKGGELTPLGQLQHRGIAERMLRACPELFRKGSRIVVRTTNLERTMLSMAAFTGRLQELRSGLVFDIDGTHMEMGYLNPHSKDNPKGTEMDHNWRSLKAPWMPALLDYNWQKVDSEDFASRIFADMDYARNNFDLLALEQDLYYFSNHMDGCPVENVGFFELFDEAELHDLAQVEAAIFYSRTGQWPDPRNRGMLLCESLLNDFIVKTQADLEDGVSARLRFGHDGCMIGLFALMGLPGWDKTVSSLDEVWEVWNTSSLCMAANIQLRFFRKGEDVIFAPLLSESPMVLPLEECAPGFYRWSDFVEKYSAVVEDACEILKLN